MGIEGAESALSSLDYTLIIKMLLFRQGVRVRKIMMMPKRAAAATWPPASLTAIAAAIAGGCSDPLRRTRWERNRREAAILHDALAAVFPALGLETQHPEHAPLEAGRLDTVEPGLVGRVFFDD